MTIKKHRNGGYYAHIMGSSSPVNLHTRDAAEAMNLAKAAKLEEVEFAAKANLLTAETAQRLMVSGKKATGVLVHSQWLEHCARQQANRTAVEYSGHIERFLKRNGLESRNIANVTAKSVDTFVNGEDDVGVSTRKVRRAALSHFFHFAQAEGYLVKNPVALVKVRVEGLTFEQKEPKKRELFTEQDMIRLDMVEDPFWSVAIGLAYNYGLRLGDIAKLEWASVRDNELIVWTDKHDRRIVLPLIQAIPGERIGRYVFPVQAATRQSALSQQFTRLCAKHGVKGKCFHGLRHTFAVNRRELGDTVDEIRLKMGHVSTETTKIYLNHQ